MGTVSLRSMVIVFCLAFSLFLPALPLKAAPMIAWTEATGGVTLANRDGGGASALVTGVVSVEEVHFHPADEDWYWFDWHTIYRAGFNGSNRQTVITDGDMYTSAGDFALDTVGGHVYWLNVNKELHRAELDGSNPTLIRTGVDWKRALGVDPVGGKLVYGRYEASDTVLYMSDLDGGNETRLTAISPTWAITDIAIDSANGHIYWTESAQSANERVRRLGMSPGTPTTIIDAELGNLNDVTLDPDAGKLLMVESTYGRIYQADLDGGNFETLVDGLSQPRHIAYAPTPEPGTVALVLLGVAGLLRRRRR